MVYIYIPYIYELYEHISKPFLFLFAYWHIGFPVFYVGDFPPNWISNCDFSKATVYEAPGIHVSQNVPFGIVPSVFLTSKNVSFFFDKWEY